MRYVVAFAFLLLACDPDCNPAPIHLATFNIRYPGSDPSPNTWAEREPLVEDSINAIAPTVIGFQEMAYGDEPMNDLAADFPQYQMVPSEQVQGLYGEYLFYDGSRAYAYQTDVMTVQDPATQADLICHIGIYDFNRYITRVLFVDVQALVPFTVFNVHLCPGSSPGSVHARQVERDALLDLAASAETNGYRVYVMGDFNSGEGSGIYNSMAQAMVDTFRAINPTTQYAGTFNHFSTANFYGATGARLDYIFADQDRTLDAYVDYRYQDNGDGTTTFPSDHYAVAARVEAQLNASCQ